MLALCTTLCTRVADAYATNPSWVAALDTRGWLWLARAVVQQKRQHVVELQFEGLNPQQRLEGEQVKVRCRVEEAQHVAGYLSMWGAIYVSVTRVGLAPDTCQRA